MSTVYIYLTLFSPNPCIGWRSNSGGDDVRRWANIWFKQELVLTGCPLLFARPLASLLEDSSDSDDSSSDDESDSDDDSDSESS